MNEILLELTEKVDIERCAINEKIANNNTPFLFIDLVKAIDYYWLGIYENKNDFEAHIRYGFPLFLKQFYLTSNFNGEVLPIHKTSLNSLSFCHYYLWMYGKCEVVRRYIKLTQNNEVLINKKEFQSYQFTIPCTSTLEYIENTSINEYFKVMREFLLKEKIGQITLNQRLIDKLLKKEVKVWRNDMIRYGSKIEIDKHYYQKGYIALMTTQLYDDFNEDFTFGKVSYKQILDVIQAVMGTAIKHIDACMILMKKDPKIKLYNIISTPFVLTDLYESYARYLNIDTDIVKEIFDLLVVSPDNIDCHTSFGKDFSPPFIKIGKNFVYRSIRGCLTSPILFIQNGLKNKYPKDYFKWINEREEFFRNQLYGLFKFDRFSNIERNIEINANGIRTDIDAVIFDNNTKSLGIFQLKWQDKFAADIQARKSRIMNFYPKTKEWIDKINFWISQNDTNTILSSLNIKDSKITNVYLFVIGRYNTYFSNQEIDERAAWGSWYHILELSHKIKFDFDDPIRELYIKLRTDSPRHKGAIKFEDDSIELGALKINWHYE